MGYDGAPVMSGNKTGVQMWIKALCSPKAIYVHCHCHLLQLALVSSSKINKPVEEVLRTLMGIWKVFHYSSKKKDELVEMMNVYNSPVMKMIKPSDTRWVAYERCTNAVRISLVPLKSALEHISAETGWQTFSSSENIIQHLWMYDSSCNTRVC